MKNKLKIKATYTPFLIVGMVLLFLISPCKVRNYIEAELGVAQTKVLNKNQSTATTSNCLTFENSEVYKTSLKKYSPKFIFFKKNTPQTPSTLTAYKKNYKKFFRGNKQSSSIPLYILYKNLKIYA